MENKGTEESLLWEDVWEYNPCLQRGLFPAFGFLLGAAALICLKIEQNSLKGK